MGIDIYALELLLKVYSAFGPLGETLQLGRQELHIPPEYEATVDAMLAQHSIGERIEAMRSDGYADRLFNCLGVKSLATMDASDYEGAEIVHDMNEPIPAYLEKKFDTVLDGGSLEHIFDVRTAFRNSMKMVKIGGRIITINGANNFLGHGFYQFSPELMHRVFSPENGFEVKGVFLVDKTDQPKLQLALDPAHIGTRYEFGSTPRATYIMAVAQRIDEGGGLSKVPQQSDYLSLWHTRKDVGFSSGGNHQSWMNGSSEILSFETYRGQKAFGELLTTNFEAKMRVDAANREAMNACVQAADAFALAASAKDQAAAAFAEFAEVRRQSLVDVKQALHELAEARAQSTAAYAVATAAKDQVADAFAQLAECRRQLAEAHAENARLKS